MKTLKEYFNKFYDLLENQNFKCEFYVYNKDFISYYYKNYNSQLYDLFIKDVYINFDNKTIIFNLKGG